MFWRAWLSLEWGRGCIEAFYLVLESLDIAGMEEMMNIALLPGLGEPCYRWNGGSDCSDPCYLVLENMAIAETK
jgi:hypothetical protein